MSGGALDLGSPDAILLALLLAGHLVADFLLQPWRMVAGKREGGRWLLAHGAVVLATHAALLCPFFRPLTGALLAVACVALLHVAIDRLKIAAEARFGRRLAWFVLDQGLHGASMVGLWLFARDLFDRRGWWPFDPAVLGSAAVVVGAFAFITNGGSAAVAGVLLGLRRQDAGAVEEPEAPHAGHVIGVLERLTMLPLVWLGEWGALAFVLAAKSVARFKDLEDRTFAEIYLVGTLTSFLVALGGGTLLRALVPLE